MTARFADPAGLVLLVLGQRVAAQRPEPERDEGQRRDEVDPPGGQRRPEAEPDADRHEVDDRGGDRDADEHRPHAVAGGEGHGHELGLVAQLGDEDDAEGDERADEYGVHAGRASFGPAGTKRETRPGSLLPGSKVSPASPERGRAAGRRPENRRPSVCRPRHWGLLPFAAPDGTRHAPAGAAARRRDHRLTRLGPPAFGSPPAVERGRRVPGRIEDERRRPHQQQGHARAARRARPVGRPRRARPGRHPRRRSGRSSGRRRMSHDECLPLSGSARRCWGRRCRSRGSCGRSSPATWPGCGRPRPCCPRCRAAPPRSRRTPATRGG